MGVSGNEIGINAETIALAEAQPVPSWAIQCT